MNMSMTRVLSVTALCLALAPAAVLARSKLVEMESPATVTFETKATPAQVKKGVKMAVLNRKWNITNEKGSEFDAEYLNTFGRDHWSAKIHVAYTSKSATITYVSSDGLNADGKEIHPTYNRIVGFLKSDIPIYIEREVVSSQ
jgi:hypothetical protein